MNLGYQELREMITDTHDQLIGTYVDEIYVLKRELLALKGENNDKIFYSANDEVYYVLDEQGSHALLAPITTDKYVVAYGLDRERGAWQGGSYWNNMRDANNRFMEAIKD